MYRVLFHKLVVIEEPEVWGAPLPEQHPDFSLATPFPTGSKSLLVWHGCHHPGIVTVNGRLSGTIQIFILITFPSAVSINLLISRVISRENQSRFSSSHSVHPVLMFCDSSLLDVAYFMPV